MLVSACNSDNQHKQQALVDEISARWVPDKREGICSITVDKGKNGTLVLRGETSVIQARKEISDALESRGFKVIDSISVLPDTINNSEFRGIVTLSVVNLRKSKAHSSELVSQAIMGTPVLVLRREGSWMLVQTPDRYIAWTESSSVMAFTTAELNRWKRSRRMIYIENSGWLYSSADKKEVVSDLVAGCIVVKKDESDGCSLVVLPDGREGYIDNGMIADLESISSEAVASGDNVVSVSSGYMGLPYLWGGTSSKAVDCSGFVQSVFLMNGLIVSRDASLQAGHGMEVDVSGGLDGLEKGDLLFFGLRAPDGPRVTHVAIYRGNSEFIHAASRVMINSLDSTRTDYSEYRRKTLLSARRVIEAEDGIGIVPLGKHEWYY